MAYREVVGTLEFPEGATERYKTLNALRRMLDGTLYDDIKYDFSQEKLNDEYLPLLKRRPSAPYNLARIVVDQSNGLLWGGEQMPYIECGAETDDKKTRDKQRDNVAALIANCGLDAVMMEVYESAAPGSAAIVVRADAEKRPHFTIIWGEEAQPVYDPFVPGKMVALVQVYPTTAEKLKKAGVTSDGAGEPIAEDDTKTYWCRIEFDSKVERRFLPLRGDEYKNLGKERDDHTIIEWVADQEYAHKWGVVNAIWARNLIGGGDGPDGRATYGDIVDIQVEIAYLLSQIGRGYRYTADPLLVRKKGELADALGDDALDPLGEDGEELKGPQGQTVRSAANVLEVGKDGDAKLLEITGNGLKAAGEHVKQLREWALEVVGAMKADASNTKGVSSGRALEMLYQALQLLLKRQRIAFGTRVFVPLIRLLLTGITNGAIEVDDVDAPDPAVKMTLKWPQWLTPRGSELLATVQAWETAAGGSPKNPVMLIAPDRAASALASELGFNEPNAIVEELEAARRAAEDDDEETDEEEE